MANVYVRSGAAGAGTGADWTNAYTTLSAALTAKAAGDDFWVSEDHAEVTAGPVTLAAPGTLASSNRIICVNHAGSVPPVSADLATTATVSTTGANNIVITGWVNICYGIQFQAASTGGAVSGGISLSNTSTNYQRYDSCVFRLLGTSASTFSTSTGAAASCFFNNCTAKFASISSSINIKGKMTWQNSTVIDAAGSLPTTVLTPGASTFALFEGCDFSAVSAKTLVAAAGQSGNVLFKDCKLPASVTISAAQTTGIHEVETVVVRADSGATNYRNEKYNYAGTLTTETTIVRTGGASDGTTPVAFKIVTTANSRWQDQAFTCLPISTWNDTSGSSVTATVYGIWGGGAVPNNDEIWIDVEYLGAAGSPLGSFISSTKADPLAAGAGVTSDASTWGGSTTAFKLAVTFTPQQKGPVTVYVRAAKASSTFYIDPKVVLT